MCAAAGIDIDRSYREFLLEIRVDGPALSRLTRTLAGQRQTPISPYAELSPTQRRILTLLAQGLNAREAAEQTGMAYNTVKDHMKEAKLKLGARTAAHAVVLMIASDLGGG